MKTDLLAQWKQSRRGEAVQECSDSQTQRRHIDSSASPDQLIAVLLRRLADSLSLISLYVQLAARSLDTSAALAPLPLSLTQ
ncbi:hypothetical protein E2562_006505 [Oryza meyeriana var. granulata]|uniref:Uncharacterized protein n=1 Tax=Oryza meyeriana var. granulata TaxID=110450 RepID=A0A6G1CMM5_9ORYZ|nr:hypothetical protein E2562_006505 [Oryza meyeriana var. granulata]